MIAGLLIIAPLVSLWALLKWDKNCEHKDT
jgi:hypothetical protein